MLMDSLLSMLLFFLFTLFSFNPSSYASQPSYKDHCGSIVSYATPNNNNNHRLINTFPLGDHHTGYFTGGDRIIGLTGTTTRSQFSFYLKPRNIHATEDTHVFKLEALVSFRSTNMWNFSYSGERLSYGTRRHPHHRDYVTFKLEGFWSNSSGKVCMVGTGSGFSETGEYLNLDAVFKLNDVFSSCNVSSLISGSLESLSDKNDKSFFEPISVLMFPMGKYIYTLDSSEAENDFFSGSDAEQGLQLNFNSLSFCSYPLSSLIGMLQLEYSSDCNSSKNCTPIISGELPTHMSLRGIECSHSESHKMRVLVEFFNTSSYYGFNNQGLDPKTMLVGEGWWNEKSNMLCVVACHIMDKAGSTHVGDCSVRLRLWFPSIWSIKNTSTILGQIWSKKDAKESGYFKRIMFRNDQQYGVGGQGLEYEYSQLERVNQSCQVPKHVKGQGKRYPIPDANSYDMRFDMTVRESKKKVAWGYSAPLSVGSELDASTYFISSSSDVPLEILNSNNNASLFNISYKISISPMSTSSDKNSLFNKSFETVKIAAEGIYDAEGGTLCMVGCRDLPSNNGTPMAHSVDCEVLLKFQFPPLDSNDGSRIKGSIESTRKEFDPLYFKRVDLSAATHYREAARRNAWRMDMEVIMALISTTLACVFVGLQLYHVKRNPNVLPFISLIMMSILTFGHMILLVLNFEALLIQDPNNKNFVGWLEVNEITVRLITMVAFLLQSRLLYLTWSSRKTNESKKSLWIAEKKATFVTLPLYAVGLLIALLFKLKNHGHKAPMYTSMYYHYQQHSSSLEIFKSYGGLVLDGFLLPQIMLNIFSNMRDDVLSCSFYFGTTFVRLLPHAYDLYRAHNYAQEDDVAYFYADPSANFYSTAWDIAIPLGGILFAAIIYLQQHFGALCILPGRFRGSVVYEKVPVVNESEAEVETTNMERCT